LASKPENCEVKQNLSAEITFFHPKLVVYQFLHFCVIQRIRIPYRSHIAIRERYGSHIGELLRKFGNFLGNDKYSILLIVCCVLVQPIILAMKEYADLFIKKCVTEGLYYCKISLSLLYIAIFRLKSSQKAVAR